MVSKDETLAWLHEQVKESERLEEYALTEEGKERGTVKKQTYFSVIDFIKNK